jgi:hypothetical protein
MKTCPLTILVAVAIVMYFLLNTFFSYSKETYFREETISDNLPITFGSVIGVYYCLLKNLMGKAIKQGKTELIIV